MPAAEFETWRVYDADYLLLSLKVRYRDDVQVPYWRDGPDLVDAIAHAVAGGWEVYDREPGGAPGERAILHLIRRSVTTEPR